VAHVIRDIRRVNQRLRRLRTTLERLLHHLPPAERTTILSDFTALESALTGLEAASTAAVAEINALKSGSDQASIDAATSRIQAVTASLNAAAPPAVTALTVSPSPVAIPVGSTTAVPLTFTGATGAVSVSGLPTGVTFDGTSLTPDGTQAAGSSPLTFTDSASPPLTVTDELTIS
jgi:hypothetical protein